MATYEDKIDILVEKVGDLAVSVKGIEVRLDNVEDSLKNQEETLRELSSNSSTVRIRLAEIDAEDKARGSLWSRLQPFFLVVFTMGITGAVTTALHVYR
jgi:endonuclease YncB( thermonuclease family)